LIAALDIIFFPRATSLNSSNATYILIHYCFFY